MQGSLYGQRICPAPQIPIHTKCKQSPDSILNLFKDVISRTYIKTIIGTITIPKSQLICYEFRVSARVFEVLKFKTVNLKKKAKYM